MKQYKNPNVGIGAIVRRGNEVLMVRRRKVHGGETWSTPGGYLDFGESPEKCAIRETLEETGITANNAKFRAITNDVFAKDDKHFVTIWMEAEYVSGEVCVASPDEIEEVGWFSIDQLPKPLFLSFKNLLDGKCYPRP